MSDEYDPYEPRSAEKERVGKALRPDADEEASGPQTVAAGQLRAFIERIERLEEAKQEVADDIKQVFAEAKSTGFDVKAMRALIRLRKKDEAKREEEEAMLDLYKHALGMV